MNTSTLVRWSGATAMTAGIIFAAIQPIHPPDVLASVTTDRWVIIQSVKAAMCIFGLIGMTGLYVRQAHKIGWLGLVGYVLFCGFYAVTFPLVFAEAFILPLLATDAPRFVEGFLGIINGHPVDTNLGIIPTLYVLAGTLGYVLGGVLFGVATLRAAILPRWAAILFIVGALAPFVLTMLPHPLDRTFAVPMGVALAALGLALWMERSDRAVAFAAGSGSPHLRQTAVE